MPRLNLPIDPYLERIAQSLTASESLILTAPPGSGKTTRVPPALLRNFKKIVVLVPRRIAAVSTAVRVCEEEGYTLGAEVGYQVRFDNKTSAATRLIFMTEGVFIKKLNDPGLWRDLELVVFDEFHERSSPIDLALGICLEKQILEQKIKLLVMSATLGVEKLQTYLGNPALVEVADKPFPLEIIYSKKAQRLSCDRAFNDQLVETLQVASARAKKDILVFLPGLSEIRFAERTIREKLRGFEINILHGSVKLEEQKKILEPAAQRRIILATNVAESSITIPSVDCVVDSGLQKNAVTESKIGFKRLELNRISLFSARQRAGRAARTGPGLCYRLWHEMDERSMPEQILPEIIKSDLLEESLTLLSLGITNPDQFSWLDKPKKKFKNAFDQLLAWGLIGPDFQITAKGTRVQNCPLDTERGLLFVELCGRGFQAEASEFMAFLETHNFDKQTESLDLEKLPLSDQGRRIETQLNRLDAGRKAGGHTAFKDGLILIFFRDFPNRIAKRKDRNLAVSSLGRGVELSPYLVSEETDYFLLLSGREQAGALTKCDFAVGFSSGEFEKFSVDVIRTITEISFDAEKRKLYKIDKKVAGFFVISESAKAFLNEKDNALHFQDYFKTGFAELLLQHEDYKNYVTKMSFLKRKSTELNYAENEFEFLESLAAEVLDSVSGSIGSVEEFFNMRLWDILLFSTPETFRRNLQQLPRTFTLPNGKQLEIDYESEQAPKISALIRDFFRQKTTPLLLDGKLRMTIELLAPNHRPTQVTSQLETFWKVGYFEIRKELKARYPRQPWPDDPTEYVHVHVPRKR